MAGLDDLARGAALGSQGAVAAAELEGAHQTAAADVDDRVLLQQRNQPLGIARKRPRQLSRLCVELDTV